MQGQWAVPLAVIGGMLATPAQAKSAYFYQACDGYGAPTSNGDGMTKEATGLFGLTGALGSSGNTRRITPTIGSTGISACDQALADARLVEKHWLRRASLLRARAVHDLSIGDTDRALADLDTAQAAIRTPDDPYIRRSMIFGITLVRAQALQIRGDLAGTRKLIESVWAERRFNRATGLAALAIMRDETVSISGQPVLHSIAALSPRMLDTVSLSAFNHADFRQVVLLYPQLAEPSDTIDIGIGRRDEEQQVLANAQQAILAAVDRAGHVAYALAALRQPEAARAALAAAAQRIGPLIPSPIETLADGQTESGKAGRARAANTALVTTDTQARRALETWHDLTELRIACATESAAVLAARFLALKPPAGGAVLDVLKTIAAKGPPQPALIETIARLDTSLNAPGPTSPQDLRLLFEALPHTEIGQRIATYRKANSALIGYLWGGVSGFKTISRPDGLTTVTFTGERSSSSVVEEMTLLRAADLARERGKSGIVVRARREYERTQTTTYYGAVVRSDPIGYSCELDIELVDRAALPAIYRDLPWRVIAVDDVIADLAPTYLAPPEARPGLRSALTPPA